MKVMMQNVVTFALAQYKLASGTETDLLTSRARTSLVRYRLKLQPETVVGKHVVIFRPLIMGEENPNRCCVFFFQNSVKTPLYYSI